jgi:hypothetical protein
MTPSEERTIRAILRVGRNQVYQAIARGELSASASAAASASPNKPR